jgi:hypothetical protein
MLDKIKLWLMENKILAIAVGSLLGLLALRKLMPKPRRRVKRYKPVSQKSGNRVATRRRISRAKRVYSVGGKKKKPWQIKGSLAARRHMAQIRKKR